jgi:hypothetical protein
VRATTSVALAAGKPNRILTGLVGHASAACEQVAANAVAAANETSRDLTDTGVSFDL